MAPRARSTPAFSTPMGSALDPFSPVLEPEDPRGEARGLDRIVRADRGPVHAAPGLGDRKSTRLNSSHQIISYAVFCLKKKNRNILDINSKGLNKINDSRRHSHESYAPDRW